MILLNRVKATTSTTGTGTVTPGAAVAPFRSWSAGGAVDGEYYPYLIEDGADSEIGMGLYNSAGPSITRPGPGVDPYFESSTAALLNLSGSATIANVPTKFDHGDWLFEHKDLGGLSTYTFSNIPALPYFQDIELYMEGGVTAAVTTASPTVQVNGLSTNIYSAQRQWIQNTTAGGDQQLLTSSLLGVGFPGTSVTSGVRGAVEALICNYQSALRKVGMLRGRQPNNNTTMNAFHIHGCWEINLTAAITSLTVNAGSGNFATNTYARLKLKR
jgi:hypothetical protein